MVKICFQHKILKNFDYFIIASSLYFDFLKTMLSSTLKERKADNNENLLEMFFRFCQFIMALSVLRYLCIFFQKKKENKVLIEEF